MGSYLQPEPLTYINIKLTDAGRRKLSLGQLTFNSVVFSDKETNYGIDRTGQYDLSCANRILSPIDVEPKLTKNYDGSDPALIQSVGSATKIVTAMTESVGFYSGSTNNWIIDSGLTIGHSIISYSAQTPNGSNTIQMTGGTYFPSGGELMFVVWNTIQNSGATYSGNLILSANPSMALWYRVLTASTGTSIVTLDRDLPNFGSTIASSLQQTNAYFYPFDGIQQYYGSASTVDAKVWNLNIVRTSSEIGTTPTISGYTSYGSIEYNGTKQFLGFSSETKNFGIIHYTNNYTGNTYAEQLVEGTVSIDIPHLMWHRTAGNTGQVMTWGGKFTDAYGPTVFDTVSQTSYRPLRDGSSSTSLEVGRVYHKFKIIVITDQELLQALTFKSNRNYTLPKLVLDTSSAPQFPLTDSTASPFVRSGYTYFVTYLTESNYLYSSGSSYGYPYSMPCGYYSELNGSQVISASDLYLKVNFPINAFPYMRSSGGMATYSGTGWNANKIQLLVNQVDLNTTPYANPGNLNTDSWKLISANLGNGIYSGGSTTVDPLQLQGYSFVISQEDYDSGTTYSMTGAYSAFTQNMDYLTFGDEYMFYGNVTAGIRATVFKSIITAVMPDTMYNSTLNNSFDSAYDTDIYVTEIAVLDSTGELVAIGKPTEPIKKNVNRYLAIQLEIDF
jgi:hypothetical protein